MENEDTANDVDDPDTRCHFDWPLSAEAQSPNMSAAGMADERTHTPATTVDEPATTADGPSTEVRGSPTPYTEPELAPGTAIEASHTPATSADGPSQVTHNRTPFLSFQQMCHSHCLEAVHEHNGLHQHNRPLDDAHHHEFTASAKPYSGT
ncbi:uncharacterized protein LOC142776397 [Rhipicephalus microplus]|uniref:uncharacterized protein LOC142776397 n=1 Tax=Rhipicephalus microplus TaxID=6941 RepID=UPI003F6B4A74